VADPVREGWNGEEMYSGSLFFMVPVQNRGFGGYVGETQRWQVRKDFGRILRLLMDPELIRQPLKGGALRSVQVLSLKSRGFRPASAKPAEVPGIGGENGIYPPGVVEEK